MDEKALIPKCDCKGAEHDDAGKKFIKIECEGEKINKGVKILVANHECGQNGARRRRDVSGSPDDVISLNDVIAPINPVVANYTPLANPTWPTPNLRISENQATSACNAGLRRSPAYEACKDRVDTVSLVQNCVTDIQVRAVSFFIQG